MAFSFPNGYTYLPGGLIDPSGRWAIGVATSTAAFQIVSNPFGTQVEAFSLSSGGEAQMDNLDVSSGLLAKGTFQASTAATAVSITGMHLITLSTISPAAMGGTSTYFTQLFPSSAFTFSTNDLIMGVTLPSSYGSTAAYRAVFGGAYPTSSGGVALNFFSPAGEVGASGTSTAISISTGAYKILVARTT